MMALASPDVYVVAARPGVPTRRVSSTHKRLSYCSLVVNGAGKTTFIRIIATLLPPTSGKATVFGHDVVHDKIAIRKMLGYLPQEYGAYPKLTGREYLEYIAILKGIRRPKKQIEALLLQFHLTEVAKRRVSSYSGGMLRRLGIAQALLGNPKVLLVDEPTGGLDPEERVRFREFLMGLGGERIVALSTHLVEDVAMACDQLAVLRQGKIVYQGTVAELIKCYEGKVYEVEVPEDTVKERLAVWGKRVLTTKRGDGRRAVRVLGEVEGGRLVIPSLEDAYLALIRS
ncbi:ATP-binding cassette domain-containing protein [Candidatus Bipolaricaulota bacterium]|nr:ATP-binding cassette domain-containing protein [Candidatus Bipolaricaulota bacterium]